MLKAAIWLSVWIKHNYVLPASIVGTRKEDDASSVREISVGKLVMHLSFRGPNVCSVDSAAGFDPVFVSVVV